MTHELDFLKPLVMDMFPTGSRVICNPPVLDTDEDWVLMVPERRSFHDILVDAGYHRTSKSYYRVASSITTYRSDLNNINLIVTDDQGMFDRWREATEIATQENLTNKEDRIKLFELITGRNRYNKNPSTEEIPLYRHVSSGLERSVNKWDDLSFV
jgi:hypothetical protein